MFSKCNFLMKLFLSLIMVIVIDCKLRIENVSSCVKENLPVTFNAVEKGIDSNGDQLFSIAINSSKYDLDENTKANVKIFVPSPLNPKKWYKVFDVNDNHGLCHTLNTYMYKVWHQIQEDVGVKPGMCPLKKGYYSSKSTKLQLEKLNLPAVPPGKIKVEARAYLKSNNNLIVCLLVILNNKN